MDLLGYEGEPTLEAKQQRVCKEIYLLNLQTKTFEARTEKGHYIASDLTTSEKDNVVNACKRSVTMLSDRIKKVKDAKSKQNDCTT